jgi:hypothetical protein
MPSAESKRMRKDCYSMGHISFWPIANDLNMVGENIDTIQKNTKALLDASKEVGLKVNPENTKYMLVSRCKKAGQRHSIKIANWSFKDVAKFRYLGTTLTDKNCIHE